MKMEDPSLTVSENDSLGYPTTLGVPSTEESPKNTECVPALLGPYIAMSDLDEAVHDHIISDLKEPSNLFPGM